MKILLSFTHAHIIPNLYAFLSSAEYNILKNGVGVQTTLDPIYYGQRNIFVCVL